MSKPRPIIADDTADLILLLALVALWLPLYAAGKVWGYLRGR